MKSEDARVRTGGHDKCAVDRIGTQTAKMPAFRGMLGEVP